jgi:hypothetical protein
MREKMRSHFGESIFISIQKNGDFAVLPPLFSSKTGR